jgi:hypothetical protein
VFALNDSSSSSIKSLGVDQLAADTIKLWLLDVFSRLDTTTTHPPNHDRKHNRKHRASYQLTRTHTRTHAHKRTHARLHAKMQN